MATDRPGWCDRCYRDHLAKMSSKKQLEKNVFIDVSRMVFACKIPRFTHDSHGYPIVVMWDCENKKEVTLSQKAYLEKRSRGEL